MTRPIALCPQFDQIPAELRERSQWVVWRYYLDGKKWTKVPYRAAGEGRASTTNPETWAGFRADRRRGRGTWARVIH
jgi:primase-polymerase (primpol)-like protein